MGRQEVAHEGQRIGARRPAQYLNTQQRRRLPARTQALGLLQSRDGRVEAAGSGCGLRDGKARFRQFRIISCQPSDQIQGCLGVSQLARQRRQMQKAVGRILFQQGLQYRFGLAEAALAQQQGRQGLLCAFRVLLRRRPQPGGFQRLLTRANIATSYPPGYARSRVAAQSR